MKRFISFILAMVIVSGMAVAYAKASDTVSGYYKDDKLVIESISDSDIAVLNGYDDGVICASNTVKVNQGVYEFDPELFKKADTLRLACGGQIYRVDITDLAPEATPTPPPKPTRTPRPAVYEKALDAVHAPAVIKSIESTYVNDENAYRVTMLHQGNEITANIGETVQIVSAPVKDSHLIGKTVSSLTEGDVIHFLCNLRGEVTSIDLIYRPDFADYISDGTAFGSVYGNDGYSSYVFGVAVRTYNGAILVADNTGATTDIEVDKGAFVYSVADVRSDKTDIHGIGAKSVMASAMPPNNLDDNDCVISMAAITEPVYVLIRQVRSVATEIVMLDYMY